MDKLELIKRNTEEIIAGDELKELLNKKKSPVVYWGTAPTGKIHIGYYIPMMKIRAFLKAGFKVKVLIADLHAYLDDQKTLWNQLDIRSEYYKLAVKAMIDSLGVDSSKVEFVKGSDFQLDNEYVLNVLRMCGDVSLNRAKRAAAEVVRFTEEPKVGSFIYPLMQIADVVALKADVAYSGIDQRKIYMLGRELLPKLGYKKPLCVFTPMLPGLTGEKMSSSEESSKIELLDNEEDVSRKVKNSYCVAGEINGNGVMMFLKYVIMPLKEDDKKSFLVERDKKFGGNLIYKNYGDLEKDFLSKKLHPQDLKIALAKEVNILLDIIRKKLKTKLDLVKKAYP